MMDAESQTPEAGNLDNFIKHFPVFAAAPDGITRLKNFILDLAVHGNLVGPNENLETGHALVEQIQSLKGELIERGAIKKQKVFTAIDKLENLEEIPSHWASVRLGEVGLTSTGKTPKTNVSEYFSGEVPFIGPGQITLDGKILGPDKFLSEEGANESTQAKAGDIVMVCIGGSIGKSAIVTNRITFNQQINCIKPLKVMPEYIHITMKSSRFYKEMLSASSGSATPIINRSKWENLVIPLPPIEEQERIVAKVDELMALVGKLESQQRAQANTLLQANAASINALLNPSEAASFDDNWNRIATHFNTLYGCRLPMPKGDGRQKKHLVGLENVNALRNLVFKLATTGFLSEQTGTTENHDLSLIKKTRKKLEAEKLISKYKAEPIDNSDINFVLPHGWELVHLGEVTDINSGSTPLKGKIHYYEGGTIPWVKSTLTSRDYIDECETLITQIAVDECRLKIYPVGTLLLAMYGQGKTRGQVTELRIKATTNQACAAISFLRGHEAIRPFIKLVLLKQYDEMREHAEGGAQPNLNGIKVKATIIPFPPLEEQKRIVTKVDELMAICDTLEEQLTNAYTDAEKLTASFIHHLTEAAA